MNNLYNDEHLILYRELLAGVKGMEKDGATAYQFCCCGKDYMANTEKRFMVIGRVINGWDSNINECVEKVMAADSNPDILEFIDIHGTRSAFWRVTKDVVKRLGMDGVDNWYDNLTWNNLYKVGPSGGGNPKEKVFQAQYASCNRILKYEINTLQPKYILFITGWWFSPFVSGIYNERLKVDMNDGLSFNVNHNNPSNDSIVIGTGKIELEGFDSKVVLCHRPEARQGGEEKSKNEIIKAFESLKG